MISNTTIIYTATGFISGSIMYSYLIPHLICGKDVRMSANDRNPGASNAGLTCGKGIGILCGVLDVLKGFLPVFLAFINGAINATSLVPIMVAPMLGHAFSPMLHFHGGKAIATAYGSLLAMLPWHPLGLLLAGSMLVSVLLMKNHACAVSAASVGFIIASSILFNTQPAVKLTAYIISGVLLYRHRVEVRAFLSRQAPDNERRKAA